MAYSEKITGDEADHDVLISIIIVNWNVKALLAECLESVLVWTTSQHYAVEIIVVDNASSDGSAEMVEASFPQVNLIRSAANLGFGRANNLAFREARGDYIFLLNPDTRLQSNVLEYFLRYLNKYSDVGIMGCKMLDDHGDYRRDSGGYFPTLWNVVWNFLFLNKVLPPSLSPKPYFFEKDSDGVIEVDWVSGADMFIRRSILDREIFNDDYFMYGEDLELCHRIKQKAFKVVYSSEHIIIHHQGRSFSKQTDQAVLSAVFKGPRRFFRSQNSLIFNVMYDCVLFLGFGLRWPIYSILSRLGQRDRAHERAKFFKQCFLSVYRTCFGKG